MFFSFSKKKKYKRNKCTPFLGRVIFLLPWMNHTIAGTTDTPCGVTTSPSPTEKDISFILNEVKNYLSPDVTVRRGDVLSAW